MRRSALLLPLLLLGWVACIELPASSVPLTSAAEQVEILAEAPNVEVYEPFENLSVQASGASPKEAEATARNMLRNRGAEVHARFVSVDEANAQYAWDFSGRTIVTLKGRGFRVKEEQPAPPPGRKPRNSRPQSSPASDDASAPAASPSGSQAPRPAHSAPPPSVQSPWAAPVAK